MILTMSFSWSTTKLHTALPYNSTV